ncbi:MAG: hypothetical protein V1913_03475 [Fibrobacterota bacterium]
MLSEWIFAFRQWRRNKRANVICFSLWGKDPKYLRGAVANARLQKVHYPGWVSRFYVDDTVPEEVIGELKALDSEIIMKPRGEGYQGLYWRFEAGFDPGVGWFIVRDCDSRLNGREAAAVREWMKSGKPFHVMRDHPYHAVPILGGMWGAVSGFLPEFRELYEQWIRNLRPTLHQRGSYFFSDQDFLTEMIWPRIRKKHLAHSSANRLTGRERPFSVALPDGCFVGQQFDENNRAILI